MVDRIRRSWLIVPAHDEARLAEAAHSGADVIVLDLQDTVHETKKYEARERIRAAIPHMCGFCRHSARTRHRHRGGGAS